MALDLSQLSPEVLARIQMAQQSPVMPDIGMGYSPNMGYAIARQSMMSRMAQPSRAPRGMSPADASALLSGGTGPAPPTTNNPNGITLPFPGAQPNQMPQGAHPANGFLDRLAIAFGQNPLAQASPYDSPRAQFWQGLLGGATSAWGANRRAPIEAYQQYMTDEQKQRAQENQANIQATLNAANEQNKVFPPQKLTTPEAFTIVDKDGNPVPPGTPGARTFAKWQADNETARQGQARAEAKAAKDAANLLDPGVFGDRVGKSTATAMNPGGYPYVDGTEFDKDSSQRRQALLLAHQQGLTYLNSGDKQNVDMIDGVRARLGQQAQAFISKLATTPGGQFLTLNELKKKWGSDPALAGLDDWFATNIGAFKTLANQGKGTVRITNPEVQKIQEGAPNYNTDTGAKMMSKLTTVDQQLQEVLDGAFVRDRSKWATVSSAQKPDPGGIR